VSRARLAFLLVLAAASFHLSVFLSVALGRLRYPFEVEFLEGLTIDYARTLLSGGNLYAPPSLHFAPHWYPPLHYVVCLPALWLSGWELSGARLVSILSGLGAAALGVVAVRRLGASWTAGLASVAVVFAYYPASNYWYDLARVDSLQTCFVMAGLVLLARDDVRPSRASLVGGATLLVLAVFTKQTSVVVCAASLLFFVLARDGPRQRTLLAALVTLGGLGAMTLLTAYGRDAFIIYWAPQRHFRNIPLGTLRFLRFAWTMLPLLGLAITGLRGSAQTPRGRALRFFLLNFTFAAAMGWLTLCKHGGDTNSSTPAIFLLAVCVGLGLEGSLAAPAASWRPVAISGALATFLVLAFARDFLAQIPSSAERREASAILGDMRAVRGPFLAYNASFVSTVMRDEMYPYRDRLYDWAGGENQASHFRPDPARYPSEFLDAIRERRFAAIYTDGSDQQGDYAYKFIVENYRPVRVWDKTLSPNGDTVGWRACLPRVRWEPK
jgi:hypothetical protein